MVDHRTPEKQKPKENTRVTWARSLTNGDIASLLQMKLLESRVMRKTKVVLLNELVHEIKYRLSPPKKGRDDG